MTMTAAAEIASSASRRRAGRPRMTQGASEPPTPERGRRPRLSGNALVTSLAEMVDLLIRENRQLKRALAGAEKTRVSVNLGQATKALSGLQRRLTRALDSSPATRRQRSTTTAAREHPDATQGYGSRCVRARPPGARKGSGCAPGQTRWGRRIVDDALGSCRCWCSRVSPASAWPSGRRSFAGADSSTARRSATRDRASTRA